VAKFKYLGMTAAKQNCIHDEIKIKLNLGNACYHSVQNLLSSHLLSIPVVLYGCETWYLTLREEHRLRVFEKRLLRTIFGSKREEVEGGWIRLHSEELHNAYTSQNIIRVIKS
jgi:hypothetical protein